MRERARRAMDIVAAGGLLVVLAPLMGAVAMAVWLGMGRPVLFRQQRPGLHGRPFTLYKFRTMRSTRGVTAGTLPDEVRLTRLGRFLRAASLDELPELWNVMRGEMSLVGPRPLLLKYLPLYSAEQRRRHDVRPGITGWAQVNGRNALSWEEKLSLDVWYVDNRSFLLDLQILVRTVPRVLRREGISQNGRETADEFRGSEA